MAVRETTQLGDQCLKNQNQIVTNFADPKVTQVITDLRETMISENLIGMAAPQIGENFQIFVTEPRQTSHRTADQSDEFRVYINPKIIQFSSNIAEIYEGCGSAVRGEVFGPVSRPAQITVEAFDQTGQKFRLTCDGILARVIQHEQDHLDQIEFLEKVSDMKRLLVSKFYQQQVRGTAAQAEAAHISLKKYEKV